MSEPTTDYDSLLKPELVELCRARGLTVSGTVEELKARLVEADDDDLLAALSTPDPEPAGGPSEPSGDSEVIDIPESTSEAAGDQGKAIDDTVEQDPAPAPQPKVFTQTYHVPGGAGSTGSHLSLLTRIAQDAAAAGYSVKGGARCVRVDGDHATYEVLLRRK
jgi:hypothetical protein